MIGDAEPRRSVRATKGQHTKAFEEIELPSLPKRRQAKKTKKAQGQDPLQEPEEVIRCVCGATEQNQDSGEAWISCETCFAWQHNVCVGVSSFEDEIPDNYWCERCRPQNHKELLDGIAKGEKPWEARRKAHALEEAERKKKKGGRRPKAKRTSDPKDDDADLEPNHRTKTRTSPTPDAPAVKERTEASSKMAKRKSRDDSQDVDGKSTKLRRVSERNQNATAPRYAPPADLATSISELASLRMGPAKALTKSLHHVMAALSSDHQLDLPEGETEDSLAEKYALQIERAVFDTHPVAKGQKEYSQQIKSLTFNLKNNPELCLGLLQGIHTPPTLAVMTSEQLASAEMQRQTAEMRARAEKQSILYTQELGPRVRRTHKGEEVVEDENSVSEVPLPIMGGASRRNAGMAMHDRPSQAIKRESVGTGDDDELSRRSPSQADAAQHQQQQSPSQSHFDISKVFSTVRSPTVAQNRRPSGPPGVKTTGPGFDPDVDRMLQDDNESPPYSPTEESHDSSVVWRGSLAMSSIADFEATASHIGGANFSIVGPWSKLIPKRMTVVGRIEQQSAIRYLCGFRFCNLSDIIVVSLKPASAESRAEFFNLIEYFISKDRYGVVGNKVVGNVRDTYLVPVAAGDGEHPEFMLNLVDNYIPKKRSEPMLLAVFVYRSEPEQLRSLQESAPEYSPSSGATSIASPMTGTPSASSAAPTQGAMSARPSLPPPSQPQPGSGPSVTPVPIPQPPYSSGPRQAAARTLGGPSSQRAMAAASGQDAHNFKAQQVGEAVAAEVLGGLISAPTVQFLLPQAFQMTRREWEVIKTIYERDPRSRSDLQHLGALLEKEGADATSGGSKKTATAAAAAAAAAASQPAAEGVDDAAPGGSSMATGASASASAAAK